jgi:GT2 family glycosyltransferase
VGARLSVVIVSYNTRALLGKCLDSLLADPAGRDTEVIVVDNGSTDGSADMLREHYPGVTAILNTVNRRWAGGNNQGAAVAGGTYLLFLNSDTLIVGDALGAFIGFMEGHPEAAIAGCRLLNTDGTLQRSCRGFPDLTNLFSEAFFLYEIFPRSPIFGRFYMTTFDHESVREVEMVTGAALMVRADVFREVGGFDEDYHFYGEETDFCYRALRLGHRTFFFPGAEIVHHGGASQARRLPYYRNHVDGIVRFLKKYYSGPRLAAAMVIKFAGVALRVPVYFLLGCVTANPGLLRKSIYYLRILF